MSLYFVFTVDGDWNEYFHTAKSRAERQPEKSVLLELIRRERQAARVARGKLLHFIHTSETTRDAFLESEYMDLWHEIEALGGSVGVHYHHETYTAEGMSDPESVMAPAVHDLVSALRGHGLNVIAYRGGYLAFNARHIPVLEKNGLVLDFSCDPGRYLFHDGKLAADWREAPAGNYRLSYEDHRKPGTSQVTEIPLGKTTGASLYLDNMLLRQVWKTARDLRKRTLVEGGDLVVFILTHTYEFSSFWKRLKIISALRICGRYGTFVSDREAAEILGKKERVAS